MLKTEAGIQMVHVPNKGMGGAVLDLISGQAQVLFASVPALKTQGPDRVRPIAMAEKKRSALLPDLPTMSESGMPGFAVANWSGLLAPAGLDPKIVKKLHDEIVAVLATPEMKEKVKTLGYDLIESTPKEFSEDLDADIKRWGPVAESAGIVKVRTRPDLRVRVGEPIALSAAPAEVYLFDGAGRRLYPEAAAS